MKALRARGVLRVLGLLAAAVVLTFFSGQLGSAAPAGGHGYGVATNEHHAQPGKPASDLARPQPPSNADFTGNGANTHGPYDSTRDGSASGNGNGNGQAIGKPCAGCVGKADNKNPPGQLPGPSDRNAGYECDTNHGIGHSNPAHTGCMTATTPGTPNNPGKHAMPTTVVKPVSAVVPVAGSVSGTQPVPASQAVPQKLAYTGVNVEMLLAVSLGLLGAGGALYAWSRRRYAN